MPPAKQPAIHAALLEVRRSLSGLTPGKTHQQGYKYRSAEQVYQRLTQALVDAGVNMSIEIKERTTDRLDRPNKSPAWRVTLSMRLHFTATADGSTTWSDTVGESIDYSDKCSMQAMTVGVKYGIIHAFSISEAEVEDPDDGKTEAPEPAKPEPDADEQMNVARPSHDTGEDLLERAARDAAEVKAIEKMLAAKYDKASAEEHAKKEIVRRATALPEGPIRKALSDAYVKRWPK